MSDTVHSLSTAGLGPKKQVQFWSDALTDLCGRFSVDPLEASTLEARIIQRHEERTRTSTRLPLA